MEDHCHSDFDLKNIFVSMLGYGDELFFSTSSHKSIDSNYHEKIIVYFISVLLIVLGLVVLFGWRYQIHILTGIVDGFPTLKANTAMGMILLGLSLVGLLRKWPPILKKIPAILLLILGSVSLIERLLDVDFGLDQILFEDPWSEQHPGLMSAGSAVAFFLSGALLITAGNWTKKRPVLYDVLFVITAFGPLSALFTYVYNPADLFVVSPYSTMALHTTMGFLFFLAGLMLYTDDNCALRFVTIDTLQSKQFLMFIAPVTVIPLLIGGAIMESIHTGFMNPVYSIAMGITAYIIIISIALVKIAHMKEDSEIRIALFEHRQKILQHRLLTLLDLSGDGILLFDVNGNVLHANQGAEQIFGWSVDELHRMKISELIPEQYRERHNALFNEFLTSEKVTSTQLDPLRMIALHKNGRELPVTITVSNEYIDQEHYSVAIIRNNEIVHKKLISLQNQAEYDLLTGLRNRRTMESDFKRFRGRKKRRRNIAIFMLDLDYFKSINDNYGHVIGDRVLALVSEQCMKCIREEDRMYRYGGEEFVVLARDIQKKEALVMGERIRNAIENLQFTVENRNIDLGISIGISFPKKMDLSLDEALFRADKAMYRAKKEGRNRVICQ